MALGVLAGDSKPCQEARMESLAVPTEIQESDGPDSMRRRFEAGIWSLEVRAVVAEAQENICKAIEDCDGGAKFCREPYTRASGGGGVARVLTDGNVFEKAGVNLSVVYGEMPQEALQAATERGVDRAGGKLKPGEKVPFFACGLSSVMHPKNPFCPTMHFNYRYFETENGVWWFGGGTDITPPSARMYAAGKYRHFGNIFLLLAMEVTGALTLTRSAPAPVLVPARQAHGSSSGVTQWRAAAAGVLGLAVAQARRRPRCARAAQSDDLRAFLPLGL
ncbi:unnamed protein product [Effrenium voratum]|nr:unnamed protein product [Effrenium voratum]